MRAMREQLQINSRADSCPGTGSSIPPTRHLCQHGWRCETPPPKRLPLGDRQVAPRRRRFTRSWFGAPRPAGLVACNT
jgi:hypothetical protein